MPKLSICIATYNRGEFIAATLDSLGRQLRSDVEVVIVDGASTDNTAEIIQPYLRQHRQLRYFREPANSGVDADYDKAVGYAAGEYCWLMTDDDVLHRNAVDRVLSAISDGPELVVINAETRTHDLSRVVERRRLALRSDRTYAKATDDFFTDCASYLSYIGAVVIRRAVWLSRERSKYYGSLFVHVAVIFQQPVVENIRVVAEPLIIIRLGNAMWTPRSFEIWSFKWPQLVWSFDGFSQEAKQAVCDREPWRRLNSLVYNRAIGAYSVEQYRTCVSRRGDAKARALAYLVGRIPGFVANWVSVIYVIASRKREPLAVYSLLSSPYSNLGSRILARAFGFAFA